MGGNVLDFAGLCSFLVEFDGGLFLWLVRMAANMGIEIEGWRFIWSALAFSNYHFEFYSFFSSRCSDH